MPDKNKIVECPSCNTQKVSNPTPDGDDICPNCGEMEMLDAEDNLCGTPHNNGEESCQICETLKRDI